MNKKTLVGVSYVSAWIIVWGTVGSLIDFLFLQNTYLPGSLGQFSTAYVLVEAYNPIGYLEWSDSYTEYMTRGMRNTTTVKWTPEAAHSHLENGSLSGGYTIRVTISNDNIDTLLAIMPPRSR